MRTISQRSKKRLAEGEGYDNVQNRPHRGSPGCPDLRRSSLADKPCLGGLSVPFSIRPRFSYIFHPLAYPVLWATLS